MYPPVDMHLTDFEDKNDLPSPPSLFVKKILSIIFSQKTKFLATPTRAKDGRMANSNKRMELLTCMTYV
jgi:hypothetical protein